MAQCPSTIRPPRRQYRARGNLTMPRTPPKFWILCGGISPTCGEFICETTSLSFGERLEYSPTAAVPKRLTDRTFSTKSRTISDVRRVISGIDTEDFFSIWSPEIKPITERIIRKKRRNHGIPAKICKRDIINAFKRVPLRPDYIAIFRHQFESQAIGLRHDATIGWLARPFGFAASPAIFEMSTDFIQRAHRRYRARDGSWSGWASFYAEISADGAIFVETEMGNISSETVA